jgi:4-amino-4-deoxy-L-arabinose transferase-like glycosyltransferase
MARKLLPFGVLLLAFALRLIALNTRPLWYDEAFAVLFAEKGFRAMLAGTLTPVAGAASDVHPIAYYTALNGWMQVFGQSPFAVRLLSVFLGLLTVAVSYAIGRQLFNGRAATAGMAVIAVSPFHIYYSQETRMYAPLALFCALTILFFLHAARNTQYEIRNWLGLALSAALAMYMQNLAAFFLLAFGLSTLPRPKMFAKVAAAGAVAFALWLPWFLNLPGQFAKLRQAYWVTRPDFVTLLQTALVYHAGEELVAARVLLPLALFTAIVLPVFLGWQTLKRRRETSAQGALWLMALAAGTPLLLFLASLYQPVYIQRALLPASLMYSIALGWLLAEAAMPAMIRVVLGGLLAVTAMAGLWAHYTFAQFPRPDFPAAVAFLQQNAAPGDVILHSNKLAFFPMHYYDRALPQTFLADPPGSGNDTLALPTQDALGLFAVDDAEAATQRAGQVWLVIFDRAIEEYGPEQHPHLAWLKANYAVRGEQHFDDLTVYEFVRP